MSTLSRPRKASIAAAPVSPEVAPTIVVAAAALGQDMVHQPRQQLHGDVLEGQRRPVEQLEHPVAGARLDQRRHRRVAEAGIGRLAHGAEVVVGDLAADEGPDHREGDLGVGPARRGRRWRPGDIAGHVSGTYRPPSRARPASKTSEKPSAGAWPRVLTYFIVAPCFPPRRQVRARPWPNLATGRRPASEALSRRAVAKAGAAAIERPHFTGKEPRCGFSVQRFSGPAALASSSPAFWSRPCSPPAPERGRIGRRRPWRPVRPRRSECRRRRPSRRNTRPISSSNRATARVQILPGTESLTVYDRGHDGEADFIRSQGSITRTARECHALDAGTLSVKLGVAGRVVAGPKGGAGTVTMPLRVAVSRQHDGTVLFSKAFTVPGDAVRARFRRPTSARSSTRSSSRSIRTTATSIIFVGFDEGKPKGSRPAR